MSTQITNAIPELTALFPPNSAGREMITDIPVFKKDAEVKKVKQHVINQAGNYHTLNYLYIVNEKGQLLGVTSIREMLQAKASDKISSIMSRQPITVNPLDTVQQVALLALKHHLKMIPIVDHKKRLLGAYSSDQLLEILNKDFSNDLLRLSGVRVPQKHFAFDSLKVVWSRLPWMLVGMFGGLITGSIIGIFRSSIEAVVLLAVFIPVIMSTGATSANQSAMIFIRNLIHGDIKHWLKYLFNELIVSILLGFTLGALLFVILTFFLDNIVLAAAVSVSLFLTIIAGALIGVFTPMLLNKAKLDPSIGAGPFLTIVKDIVAMSIYFSIATWLLKFLG